MQQEFIDKIAPLIQKYAPKYGIKVNSAIIAQAILESASGSSELAIHANNFFGLKWREKRCPTSNGYYIKVGSEQNPDGSYISSSMKWFKFPNMDSGVQGYFDFINNANYSALKAATDPRTYLESIKAAGYATSIKYVENLLKVIETYNLTKYDNATEGKQMLKIALDPGHAMNTPGKRCMKSLDPKETREWFLNNRISIKLEEYLKEYNCEVLRVDDPEGKNNISLNNRCKSANDWNADIYLSIHHNAGVEGRSGGGTMVFYYSSKEERKAQAQQLYNAIVKRTGLIGNRSEKIVNTKFAVLAGTNMPAFLLENGFMDSSTDVPIILTDAHAEKTAQGMLDFLIQYFNLTKKQGKTSEENKQEKTSEENKQKQDSGKSLPYLVKITASALNVRAGAGTEYKINTSVKNGEVFTIIEEVAGWGKLKSGAGWINLKYTMKQ